MKTLKQLRTAAGLTQKTVATTLGVSTDTIKRWENGETFPIPPHIAKLMILFDVEYEEIDFIGEAVQVRTPAPEDQSMKVTGPTGEDLPQDAE